MEGWTVFGNPSRPHPGTGIEECSVRGLRLKTIRGTLLFFGVGGN